MAIEIAYKFSSHFNRWIAGASYFQTMKIPLNRGRYFDDRDVLGAPFVAIIDEILRNGSHSLRSAMIGSTFVARSAGR
jgi:hypothetical protein